MTNSEIEKFASQTLKDHQIYGIPVDPVVLANKLGIKVSNALFSDSSLSGMIAKRGNSVSILVNDSDSPNRKRFTIAHELGHQLLHLHTDGEFIDSELDLYRIEEVEGSKGKHIEEIEANKFAAALLMDANYIKQYWEKTKSVIELAEIFKVSEAAMGIRLNVLGLA